MSRIESQLSGRHPHDRTVYSSEAAFALQLLFVALFAWLARLYVIRYENLVEKLGPHAVSWLKLRGLTAVVGSWHACRWRIGSPGWGATDFCSSSSSRPC